jgi:predicted DNA-binding protein
MAKKSNLSSPVPIRLSQESNRAIKALQKQFRVNRSVIIRLAIKAGISEVADKFSNEPATPRGKRRVA